MVTVRMFMGMCITSLLLGGTALLIGVVNSGQVIIQPETSTSCPSGQVAMNETDSGTFQCVSQSPAVNAEVATSCSANQYAISESILGLFTCAQVAIGQVTGDIVNSITVGATKLVGAITLTATSPITTSIAGQTITIACPSCVTSDVDNFVTFISQGTHSFTSNVLLVNTTAIVWDFNTGANSIKALFNPFTCNSGSFVYQITTTTFVCSIPPTTNLLQGTHNFKGNILLVNTTQIGWDFNNALNSIKAVFTGGSCSVHKFVTQVTDTLFTCKMPDFTDLSGQANYQTQITNFPAACPSGQVATQVGVTLTCISPIGILGYTSTASTCTDVTSLTTRMMGFGATFTTAPSNPILQTAQVTLTFSITSPATSALNTLYRMSYGTGTPPICNAAFTGTAIGNTYRVDTNTAVLNQFTQTDNVQISNLSPNTTYWVDIFATDSSVASWTYSLPQMTAIGN